MAVRISEAHGRLSLCTSIIKETLSNKKAIKGGFANHKLDDRRGPRLSIETAKGKNSPVEDPSILCGFCSNNGFCSIMLNVANS
jgi:hypothetical protein